VEFQRVNSRICCYDGFCTNFDDSAVTVQLSYVKAKKLKVWSSRLPSLFLIKHNIIKMKSINCNQM